MSNIANIVQNGVANPFYLVDASGNPISTASPLSISLSAASGYVAASSDNAAATTGGTDYAFAWGPAGSTVINHLFIQNNTTANVQWELDATTSAGSPILTPGQSVFLDVQTTVLHLLTAANQNINGASGNNVVVRGWL
jgi:hypothetical protein